MLWLIVVVETAGILGGCFWGYHQIQGDPMEAAALAFCVPLLYLLIGGLVRFRPDTTNMGWLGGLVDRPFSWSDDYNRGLFFLNILCFPARLLMWPYLALFRQMQP